jgi:hypothetical protein
MGMRVALLLCASIGCPARLRRLRTLVIGPDHELYITTSNCDGRGDCPDDRDVILRVAK